MSTDSKLPILEEGTFVETYLARYGSAAPRMIQIGANEGKFEYAKKDGKDFVFEFLEKNPKWEAVLIEPIPEVFERLKANYAAHGNFIQFLNCAIAEKVEVRDFLMQGKDGKSSYLAGAQGATSDTAKVIEVQCIDYASMLRLVNWNRVDFIKIDAEGYDEKIISEILTTSTPDALPNFLMWEHIGPERMGTTQRLIDMGFEVFHTGLAKNGIYLDRLAIRPLHASAAMNRIFQIGFNKCATRSIGHFLKANGLTAADWMKGALAISIRDAVRDGTKPLAEWPDVNVFTDMERVSGVDLIEGYRYFKELDAAYPGAKFILNTRNMEDWIKSRHAHGKGGYTAAYRRFLGLSDNDQVFDRWRRDWLAHHLAVLDYFSGDKRAQLLIWDIDAPNFGEIERFVGSPLDTHEWLQYGKTVAVA